MCTSSTLILILGLVTQLTQAIGNSIDVSSYANIEEASASHLDFDFAVNFDLKQFDGKVTHTMKINKANVSSVFFDANGLTVSKAEFITVHGGCQIWQDARFNVTRPNDNLGDAIEVHLPYPLPKDLDFKIRFTYVTNEKTTAISWLTKEQTVGKKLPYLFTQCEDIACRSIAPMQDTPAIKITYNATVIIPNEFNVFMSANSTGTVFWNRTHTAHRFINQIQMPSYLIAIAVGDLEYKSLDHRTGVITEPGKMEEVAKELASLPELLDKTEKYLTPYIWGNYSILILPPSFPFGGMENPLLTFASPTIITGDKSQVYVATHEIAHSWSGNEVTCENWSNMWLNEGFTVFEERKVSAQIHGKEFSMVNAYLGNISMYNDMLQYGLNNSYSSLHPDISSDNPDNSLSEVPYEKGFQLLYHIETILGEEDMQKLIQKHINTYSRQSIDYEDFIMVFDDYLTENFPHEIAMRIKSQVDFDTWIKTPGLPKVQLNFETKDIIEAKELANDYINLKGASSPKNYKKYLEQFYSSLRVVFLEQLSSHLPSGNLSHEILTKIDDDLQISQTLDPECKQRWLPLGLKMGYKPVMEPAHDFVYSMGRIKYLVPIYQVLLDTGRKGLALEWLHDNQQFYHPSAVDQLKKLLGVPKEQKLQEQKVEESKQKLAQPETGLVTKILEVGNYVFNVNLFPKLD